MPHAIVEYSGNLGPEGDIPGLLDLIARELRNSGGVFPVGGIRVRAIGYDEFVVADGDPDNAFVVITFKIGPGRPEEVRKAFFDALFPKIKDHFAPLHAARAFSLAVYIEELSEAGAYRHNNIHDRLRAKAAAV